MHPELRLRPADAVATLEAVYAVRRVDDETWARGILDAVRPSFDRGLGVAVIFHGSPVGDQPPRFHVVGAGLPFEIDHAVRIASLTPVEIAQDVLRRHLHVATTSQMTGRRWLEASESWRELTAPHGMHDSAGVFASHRGLLSVSVHAPLPAKATVGRRDRWPLLQLASHMSAALRLRHALGAADAVVRPDGTVLDAARDARTASVREELRARVQRIEWARTAGRRRDDHEALEVWQGLLDGRWSLVEQHEHDGKRFYVARENSVDGAGPQGLLPRERQILALAASGLTNKVVAYTLGISPSTVSLHLGAAAAKMGARTRTDLLRLAAALGAPPSD